MNNLNFNQFYVFYLCVKHGSFKKAAQRLNVTLPAVSMQIRKLEEHLEFDLFIRKTNNLELTSKALELLPIVNAIYDNVNLLSEKIHDVSKKEKTKLVIGLHSLPAQYLVPFLIPYYTKFFPEKEIDFILGEHDEVLEKLKKQEIDIALLADKHQLEDVYQQAFIKSEVIYAVCPQHPLVQNQPVSLKKIEETPTIFPSKGASFRNYILNYYNEHKLSFDNVNLKLGTMVARKLLPKTDYASFFTDFFIANELKYKILIPLILENPIPPIPFYFACMENSLQVTSVQEFFQCFEDVQAFNTYKNQEINII